MTTCRHCKRDITREEGGGWIDPQADGGDILWRETCDENDTERAAPHEPARSAFYVDEAFMTPDGIVPAYVTEGESGYGLMLGNGPYSVPWFWGTDMTTAQTVCDDANRQLGLTPEEAREVVDSSIRAQNTQETARENFERRWAEMKGDVHE